MSIFRPLGLNIPNPVIVDVANFFAEEELFEFNLASPRAHSLSLRYNLCQQDLEKLDVFSRGNQIKIKFGSFWEGYSYRNFENIDEAGTARKIGNCLKMCRSIDKLVWKQVKINETIMTELLQANAEKITIEMSEISVSSDLFLKFIQRPPKFVHLKKVELANNLLSDQVVNLLGAADVYCSWKRDKQTYEHRTTELSDDFLNEGDTSIPFRFAGFCTNFTVAAIESLAEDFNGKHDFGILGFDQLSAAIEYKKLKTGKKNNLKLFSWNAHDENMDYENYDDDNMFWNDSEPSTSPSSVPENIVSSETLKAFDNYVNVFNGLPSFDLEESEKYDISFVSISYEVPYPYKLEIKYKLDEKDLFSTLVKTDLDRGEALQLIEKFLNRCRSIGSVLWTGFVLDDEFYEYLKPIGKNITVRSDWMIHVALNVENFCETFNSSFFKLYPRILPQHLLTNEVISLYIQRGVEIDIKKMFDMNYEKYYPVPLTDDLLYLLVSKGNDLPKQFYAESCVTEFTANGVKAIIEAFSLEPENTYKYNLGTFREENGKEVEEMLDNFKDENPGNWQMMQLYKTESNGTRSCVVTLSRNTVLLRETYMPEYATTTVEFEVVRKMGIVERKTRKRPRASSESDQE